ncbi:MAG: dNTP triphosphohydrolase [Candidatus Eisenbacteria bacterium]|nr:dNTP triphosphohydrolase [Candidatus Eisenbacteria bacterium]
MCVYSQFWLKWEKKNLAPYAVHSDHPWYTNRNIRDTVEYALDRHGTRSRYRTAFEIDKDRVAKSQAFRRMEYKTQVFVTHEGDNYRTRLTHSIEVAETARHIARGLRLNEHLVEAIALGHDLGHAPYGHVAEKAINDWIRSLGDAYRHGYYFCHNRQSVEIVEHLEPGYDWDDRMFREGFGQGLNLTTGVREGLLVHSRNGYRGPAHENAVFDKSFETAIRKLARNHREKNLFFPGSLEAQVVCIADRLAQRIHDLEDGFRSGILKKEHIRRLLKGFLDKLEPTIIDRRRSAPKTQPDQTSLIHEDPLGRGDHLIHRTLHTKVSRLFLDQIVTMVEYHGEEKDSIGKYMYTYKRKPGAEGNPSEGAEPKREDQNEEKIRQERIDEINRKLMDDAKYRGLFLKAAMVAFLLHMWRDEEYLTWQMSEEDQRWARSRVLKYLKLLLRIIGDEGGSTHRTTGTEYPPSYHIIAFLRGVMLANAIEHSFWNIHSLLDPSFRLHYDTYRVEKNQHVPETLSPEDEANHFYYMVFVIVDGITHHDATFEPYNKDRDKERRFCFRFQTEKQMTNFIRRYYPIILESNGRALVDGSVEERLYSKPERICWLNKSSSPQETEWVEFDMGSAGQQVPPIPLQNVKICFTGYRDLCPGIDEPPCKIGRGHAQVCDKNTDQCPFYSSRVRYPDVERLIDLHDHVHMLDRELKGLIKKRIHSSSRVARMNHMGEKVIRYLLNMYLENPRTMHDRVWSRLRAYQEMPNVHPIVKRYIDKSTVERETDTIPQDVLMSLLEDPTAEMEGYIEEKWRTSNRYALVRRIIEHVTGMTDRFIANEYNRANQCGREVELQDETYFIS